MKFSKFSDVLVAPPNALYQLKERLLAEGREIVDLISGSPTRYGLRFPSEILREEAAAALDSLGLYEPDPNGRYEAREAVAGYYQTQGISIEARNLLLTPGTSLSYQYCFKLLADPGDEVLVPSPTYPLFDYIAGISSVKTSSYRLLEEDEWGIDLDYLEACITTKTRAVVVISPHNPAGSVATEHEVRGVAEIANRHGLAIIADEVFSEFLFENESDYPRPAQSDAPLVFTLNGFSKLLALPGLKLGWIAVTGKPQEVERSLERLEMISDTFLPVSDLVQGMTSGLLRRSESFRDKYRTWVRSRYQVAMETLAGTPAIKVVKPRGGFYAVLRWDDAPKEGEELVLEILRKTGILVHPGYFYELGSRHLVLSFIQRTEVLRKALVELSGIMT